MSSYDGKVSKICWGIGIMALGIVLGEAFNSMKQNPDTDISSYNQFPDEYYENSSDDNVTLDDPSYRIDYIDEETIDYSKYEDKEYAPYTHSVYIKTREN